MLSHAAELKPIRGDSDSIGLAPAYGPADSCEPAFCSRSNWIVS